MRQKILGGIGICGRCLCCHTYLTEFAPVSIKMAKGTEPVSESDENIRSMRKADVLSEE